jgi:MHS family proline/betaine transporter-like MFS transporter
MPEFRSTEAVPATQPPTINPRRVALAASVGTIVEYYDFSIYGYMAVIMAPLFFPSQDPVISLLSSLAVFGVSFVVRPLGGLFFGSFGDRVGRKKVLALTILTMGVGSAAVGMLPVYAQVGVLAPILLVLCRLVQGFSAGGEVGGAATYVAETAPKGKRGLFGSATPIGAALGFASAAAVAGLASAAFPTQMAEWGWRIPFLIALPLAIIGLYIRLKLEDSPAFEDLATHHEVAKTPLRELLKNHWRSVLRVAALGLAQNAGAFISLTYMNVYLSKVLGYDSRYTYWLIVIAAVFAATMMPAAGALSDKKGRRPLLLVALGGYILLPIPAMLIMAQDNFALAAVGMVVLFLPYIFMQAVGYPSYAEMFPSRVRYSGVSMGFNIGALLGGAFAPLIATSLVSSSGNPLSPAFLLMAAAVIGLLGLYKARETAKSELQH